MNRVFIKNFTSGCMVQAFCANLRLSYPAVRLLSSHHQAPPSPSQDQEPLDGGEKEPHILHAVWRTRSLKRRPYWERDIIKQLKLEGRKPVIHKNTPLVNSLLTKVRHLVRIKPVNPVYGFPDGDCEETLLKWNGDFVVKRKLKPDSKDTPDVTDGHEHENTAKDS